MEDRIKISIMNATDQMDIAFAVLGLLTEKGFEISDEIADEVIDRVMVMTDDFSIGYPTIVDEV